jgi:GTP cyclohydrolase I
VLKDVQNYKDGRKIPIQKAGISGLEYPICVMDRENKTQQTVARVSMYVDLPHHYKGTHMSRFVEILEKLRGKISPAHIEHILQTMVERFDSNTAHLEIKFPYFKQKQAPVSKAASLMSYQCAFLAAYNKNEKKNNKFQLVIEVNVPVTTLCPCSKAISRKGAHNQRSIVTVKVLSQKLVWIEELIELVEKSASSGVYSLLKRADEKFVTEQAYNKPRFAEDIARAVAAKLKSDDRVEWFMVESENFESIHNHNAYAMVAGGKRDIPPSICID